MEGPGGETALRFFQLSVGDVADVSGKREAFGESVGQARGEMGSQHGGERRARLAALGFGQPVGGHIGQEVERDFAAMTPIGGDLQDRGAGQAAMGEERGFAEGRLAVAGDDGRCDTG